MDPNSFILDSGETSQFNPDKDYIPDTQFFSVYSHPLVKAQFDQSSQVSRKNKKLAVTICVLGVAYFVTKFIFGPLVILIFAGIIGFIVYFHLKSKKRISDNAPSQQMLLESILSDYMRIDLLDMNLQSKPLKSVPEVPKNLLFNTSAIQAISSIPLTSYEWNCAEILTQISGECRGLQFLYLDIRLNNNNWQAQNYSLTGYYTRNYYINENDHIYVHAGQVFIFHLKDSVKAPIVFHSKTFPQFTSSNPGLNDYYTWENLDPRNPENSNTPQQKKHADARKKTFSDDQSAKTAMPFCFETSSYNNPQFKEALYNLSLVLRNISFSIQLINDNLILTIERIETPFHPPMLGIDAWSKAIDKALREFVTIIECIDKTGIVRKN